MPSIGIEFSPIPGASWSYIYITCNCLNTGWDDDVGKSTRELLLAPLLELVVGTKSGFTPINSVLAREKLIFKSNNNSQ